MFSPHSLGCLNRISLDAELEVVHKQTKMEACQPGYLHVCRLESRPSLFDAAPGGRPQIPWAARLSSVCGSVLLPSLSWTVVARSPYSPRWPGRPHLARSAYPPSSRPMSSPSPPPAPGAGPHKLLRAEFTAPGVTRPPCLCRPHSHAWLCLVSRAASLANWGSPLHVEEPHPPHSILPPEWAWCTQGPRMWLSP